MWPWEQPDWPNFVIDEGRFADRVEAFHRAAERLSGNVEAMGADRRVDTIIALMLSEAIATSAIEGEQLDRDSVRSSLLAHFARVAGGAKTRDDPKASGATALIVDVRRKWNRPLTRDMLGAWQTMAVPERVTTSAKHGAYRREAVYIVSGRAGHEKIHYKAPPPARVPGEMERFLDWYNTGGTGMAGPIRASIAHLWFEKIHPFEDGNGRVGRAVADHALSQALGRPTLACLATAIEEGRRGYYAAFEHFNLSGSLDMTGFADYFTDAIVRAQNIARDEVGFILEKSRFFDRHRASLNGRQAKALERMFREGRRGFAGGMSTKKYVAITKCSEATARRDLSALSKRGALVPEGRGRGRRYHLATLRAEGVEDQGIVRSG